MSSSTPAAPPTGAAHKLPSLTGLRFVAALLVFLYHGATMITPIPPYQPITPFADPEVSAGYAKALASGGYVGVSFFFVLSGFVLAWSARQGEAPTAFLRRRLLKIYPTHIVTWAIAMVLFAAAYTPASTWLPNLFLVHSFSTDPATFISVNSPSWSLSSELLFYLLFPLLIKPIRAIAERRLWLWAGVLVAGIVAVALIAQFLVPGEPRSPFMPEMSMDQFWSAYYFPPARLFEFALGMVLARLVAARRWPRIGVLPAAVFMVIGYVVSLYLPIFYRFVAVTAIPIAVLICATAMADIRGKRTGLGGKVMRWLGERSFGFYMAQGIVLFYGRTLVGNTQQYSTPVAILVLIGFLLANILAGWLLYAFVERPIMRRWGRKRKTRQPAADTAVVPAG